jgi:glycosyltransferase involved in cell wall biosynthesis
MTFSRRKPMNIAVFSDSYYPYISGVVRSIELFRQELQKLGHNVYIFAPSYYRQGEEEGVFRFPSVTAPTNKGFSLALPFAPGAGKMIRELKIDYKTTRFLNHFIRITGGNNSHHHHWRIITAIAAINNRKRIIFSVCSPAGNQHFRRRLKTTPLVSLFFIHLIRLLSRLAIFIIHH